MATEIVIQETVFNIDTGTDTSNVEITISNDQGPQGSSGIIAVTSPITNSGTSTSAQIGINQAALAIGPSQVTGTAVVKTPTATQTITNSTNGIVPLAINQTATNHALTSTLGASSGADTVALNVVSSNELSSAMWLSGKERAHGTLKIAHVQPDTASDANAAAISINLHPSFDYQSVIGTASFSSGATSATFTASSGTPTVGQQFKGTGVDSRTLITAVTGASSPFTLTIDIATTSASDAGEYRTFTPTAAQGIFIDTYETPGGAGYTSSGTTGSLLNLRNGGNSKLVLNANGQLQLPTVSATGGITIGGDTELFRAASKVLRSNSALYLNNTTSDSVTLYTSVTSGVGGSVAPFALKNTGKLEWGASGSARDTFLYRTGVNALTTDGSLTATSFSGPLTGNVTGNVSGSSGSTTGNAATVTNGVYTTDTGTVTNTMLAGSIDATKVTGTAYTKANKVTDEYRLASTLDIIPRTLAQVTRALSNGTIYATLFTPTESFTMSNFQNQSTTGGTDVGGTTVRRMGLFTVSGNTLTLVARTASDSTLWTANSTLYTRALSTTGGYPSSYTLNAGTTYAFAVIAYNTGGTFNIPTITAGSSNTQLLQPYTALGLTGQTDFPTAGTAFGTITNNQVFARLT